jgi:hypothetical protein
MRLTYSVKEEEEKKEEKKKKKRKKKLKKTFPFPFLSTVIKTIFLFHTNY